MRNRILALVALALAACIPGTVSSGGSTGSSSAATGGTTTGSTATGGTTSSGSSAGSTSGSTGATSTSSSTGGSGSSSSSTTTGGTTGTTTSTSTSGTTGASPDDVLQQHKDARRTGVYVDAAFAKASVASVHPDPGFAPTYAGPTYAQPLYLTGPARDLVIVATEQNDVHAFDAATGAEVWSQSLGAPWPLSDLPCGNIDPLGITGTPVIDATTRTLYVDAMVHNVGHRVFALDADTGAIQSGWPIDLEGAVTSNGVSFLSQYQNQRGALALRGTTLYVPFGGHYGDCRPYHGWVVAIDVASHSIVGGWATRAEGGGIWAVGGVVLDGARPFVTTGNTFGASSWSDGEAVIELGADASFDPASGNYYAPSNWQYLDANDIDMSGTAPLLFDLGSFHAALALGKDGKAYYLDRDALGGIGNAIDLEQVSSNEFINAPAYFLDGSVERVFVVSSPQCQSGSGDLGELVVDPGASPVVQNGWCGDEGDGLPGGGSPILTSPDGSSDWVVWGVGAGGDGKLRAWDAVSGQQLFDGSGAYTDAVQRFQAPIVARGKLYVAADGKLERYLLP